jgi:AcrR family transcriptional regulator
MSTAETRERLIDATIVVICRVRNYENVTTRAIAAEAGVLLSAITYHFGSLEGLAVAAAERVYRRMNAERLVALQKATDNARPAAAPVADIARALVGPSIRWMMDPTSAYPVLAYINRLLPSTARPDLYQRLHDEIEHHRMFIAALSRTVPELSDEEIGWRLVAALGFRSEVLRHPQRTALLAGDAVDFEDADDIIERLVEVIVPMFVPPVRPVRPISRTSPTRNLSRLT